MTRNFTTALAVTCACAVAILAAGTTTGLSACIPDLPGDAQDAADARSGSSSGTMSTSSSGSSGAPPAGCGDGYIDLASGEQCDPGPVGGTASLAGCTADCTIECPAGFRWEKNNHCYVLMPQPASSLVIGAGRDTCKPMRAHIVTFASEEELTVVVPHVDAGSFWVGLWETANNNKYDPITVDYEPGWSTVCTGCYAHTANPQAGLPKSNVSGSGQPYCVQALTDLQQASWQAVPCGGVDPGLPVVCEREPVGSQSRPCDAGICIDLVWTLGKKRYVYQAVPATAAAAEQACVDLGGHLVVFETRDEREQLWKELGKLTVVPQQGLWIGLSQVDPGDGGAPAWVWDNDAAASSLPSPWGYSQPRTRGTGLTTRAYMLVQEPPLSDDTLARNDTIAGMLPYVCEVSLDGGL